MSSHPAAHLARATLFLAALAAFIPSFAHAVTISVPSNYLLRGGLVGWWTMDGPDINWTTGQVTDRSGQNNHGYAVNMSTSTSPVPGKLGQALSFDATNDYVNAGNNAVLDITDELTISVWVNVDAFTQIEASEYSFKSVLAKGNCTYQIRKGGHNQTHLMANFRDASCTSLHGETVLTTNSVTGGAWHHIVAVYSKSAGKARVYQNGIQTSEEDVSGDIHVTTDSLIIGAHTNGGARFWPGSIDDVRVYNRALSAQEIRALFGESRVRVAATPRPTPNDPLSQGLVGHWTMDGRDVNWNSGRVTDRSGQDNHGHAVSMSTSTSPVPGKLGQALSFDGVNGHVVVPSHASLEGFNAITLAAWVHPRVPQQFDSRIISKADGAGGDDYHLGVHYNPTSGNPATIRFRITTSNGTVTIGSGGGAPMVSTSTWSHLAGTYDGSNMIFYINGQYATSVTSQSGTISNSSQSLTLGGHEDAPEDRMLNGNIDDARVYNRALSADEIRTLYRSGEARVALTPRGIPEQGINAGLVGHWTFDGPDLNWTTGKVTDRSPQGNHGYVVNMSTSTSPQPGKLGQALSFDGGNALINVTTNFSSLSTQTYAAWIYMRGPGGDSLGRIMHKRDDNHGQGSLLVDNRGGSFRTQSIRYEYQSSSGNNRVTRTEDYTIPFDEWVHVAVAYDSSTLSEPATIYINGVSMTVDMTTAGTPDPAADDNALFIGNRNDGARGWDGFLDDARVYNRALSADEIRQLYNQGGGR